MGVTDISYYAMKSLTYYSKTSAVYCHHCSTVDKFFDFVSYTCAHVKHPVAIIT